MIIENTNGCFKRRKTKKSTPRVRNPKDKRKIEKEKGYKEMNILCIIIYGDFFMEC